MAYEKGVADKRYKSLSDMDDINFGLLTSEVSQIILKNLTKLNVDYFQRF